MGVYTHVTEFTSVVPPSRLFKGLVLDADNLILKIAPQIFKSVDYLEGDGGVGTIKKISFAEGSDYMKHTVDALDKDNFVYHYSLIEGGLITDKIAKVCYEVKFVASADGGSDIKNTSHYHAKDNCEIKEEDVKAGEERASGFFKLIEGYLVANPDVYN